MNDLDRLICIVKKLRAPDGCDWDNVQTSKSLIPYLLEETYEVIESIEQKNFKALKEELGDLLLHVIFQAELASEKNKFDIYDIIKNINDKLMSRHPHIFSDKKNIKWMQGNWERQKQKEKKRKSILDGVPKTLPSLTKAKEFRRKLLELDLIGIKSIKSIVNYMKRLMNYVRIREKLLQRKVSEIM